MTDKRKPEPENVEEAGLDAFFDAVRDMPVAPPGEALLARVLADAQAEQPDPARPSATSAATRRSPRIDLMALLGGWKGAAGLCAATLAGIWIGVSPPQPLSSTAQTVLGTGTAYVIDLDASAAYLGGEGAL